MGYVLIVVATAMAGLFFGIKGLITGHVRFWSTASRKHEPVAFYLQVAFWLLSSLFFFWVANRAINP